MTNKQGWQIELEILTQEIPDEHLRALRAALVRDDPAIILRSDVPFRGEDNEQTPSEYDPLGFLLLQEHPEMPLWELETLYAEWVVQSDGSYRLVGWLDRHQNRGECFADLVDALDGILLKRQEKSSREEAKLSKPGKLREQVMSHATVKSVGPWQRAFEVIAREIKTAHLKSLRRELDDAESLVTSRRWFQVKRQRDGETIAGCCPLAFLLMERTCEDDPERILSPTNLEMDLWRWHNGSAEARCFAAWWSDTLPGTLADHKAELAGLLDKILQGRDSSP